MSKLDDILAGFGPEDAAAVRSAIDADTPVAPAEPVATPEPAAEPTVDVAAEVARQMEGIVTGLRDQVATTLAEVTAPATESNDDATEEIVREITDGVLAAVNERLSAVETAVADVSAPADGNLQGGKPESRGAVEDAADENFLSEEDTERMAKDPNLAPGMLTRALRKYEERNGAYVPHDAPRVNVAPEHLQSLQAAYVPGEDFHFDFK